MKKCLLLLATLFFFVSTAVASSEGFYSGFGSPGKSRGHAAPAKPGSTIVLTFDGICAAGTQYCPIGNYYSGQGVTFGSDSLAINDDELSGYDNSGNFVGNPSGQSVAFFLTGPGDIMTIAGGFTTGFSFFYSSNAYPGSVTVYDGPNGTGNVLATLALPINNYSGEPCQAAQNDSPPDFYCNWVPVGVTFSGIAQSVDFSGGANYIGFDNVTLGSGTPGTPEPATLVLLGSGMLGIASRLRKRL
jgi:hypothetical protein